MVVGCIKSTSLPYMVNKNKFGQVIHKNKLKVSRLQRDDFPSTCSVSLMHMRMHTNKQNNTNGTNNQSSVEQVSFDSRLLLLG